LIEEVGTAAYFTTRKFTHRPLNQAFLNNLDWKGLQNLSASADLNAFAAFMDLESDPVTGEFDSIDPRILATLANAADQPKWNEAMKGPDAEGYWAAAQKEIDTLKKKDVWTVVDRLPGMNVLKSVWALRCKRFPDGTIKKLKARFCACGYGQIEGVDYFETYAPVAQWTTVRLLLMLSVQLGLKTVQVDVEAAFPSAPVEEDIYVEMPQGFREEGKVLKLKKSLYGIKQASRNFFHLLKGKLEAQGFVQSKADQCLFIHPLMVCVCYVDDCFFMGPNGEDIEQMLDALRGLRKEGDEIIQDEDGLKINVENDVAGYLGVDIHKNQDGSIELLQTGLIDRIITALHLDDDGYAKKTPACFGALPKDTNGEAPDLLFSYSSVVGMLLYLCGHSRPDLTFAVSQCARFVHCPRRIHEEALTRIGLYLKGTRTRGLVIQPDGTLKLDMYCDADFAGLWGYEDRSDPSCVKSRSGYVVLLGKCPLIWGSKLQSEIALSTMEAEYYSMSFAMKQLIPLVDLIDDMCDATGLDKNEVRRLHTTVYEDNSACLRLVRSKVDEYRLDIVKCDSDQMLGDIMTKGLRATKFEAMRKMLMGW